jgi:tetratricopeptide (TPR) repeat protein
MNLTLEKLFQVKSYQEKEDHTKNLKEFFKIESNFISMLQKSPLLLEKFKADMIKQEEENTKGLIIKVFELPLLESQIEVCLLLKLQKMILVVERILNSLENSLVTQYTLKDPFKELAQLACDTFIYELVYKIMFFETDCLITLHDYHGAAKLLKPMVVVADLFWDYKLQRKGYHLLGNCAKYLGDYKYAKIYYEKFLHMSWFSKNSMAELKAYDLLGIAFYYQNNLEMAQRYHQRSLNPDSALEDKEFLSLVETKLKDEDARRSRLLTLRPVFFRQEIMRDFLTYDGDIETILVIRDLQQYLIAPFTVENISLKSTKMEPTKDTQSHGKFSSRGLHLKSKPILGGMNYLGDFSPEGYINAMLHSNPAVYQLIQDGKFHLDDQNIKGVNLYDKTYSNIEDPKILSHMSPNNSKATFMMASKDTAEVCLEFLKRNSKERVQAMVSNLKNQLLEYVGWICRTTGDDSDESFGMPYISLVSSSSARRFSTNPPVIAGGPSSSRPYLKAGISNILKPKTKIDVSSGRFSSHISFLPSLQQPKLAASVMYATPKIKRIGQLKARTDAPEKSFLTAEGSSTKKARAGKKLALPLKLSPICASPASSRN